MQKCKPIKTFIPIGLKLFVDQIPKSQEALEYMAHLPYASEASSFMYAMVDTQPDISHAMTILIR